MAAAFIKESGAVGRLRVYLPGFGTFRKTLKACGA